MNRAAVASFAVALVAGAQCAASVAFAGTHDTLIAKHAAANGVPEQLVRRVIHIESRGNPRVISKGNYGLMQIRMGTARSMGYSGTVEGLLDADTNMTYAVKYLARAYRAAKCNADRAISLYQRGFYGTALAKCSAPPQTVVQTAKFETNALARSGGDGAAVAHPADVIKPRVVHIETISKKPAPVPAVSPAKFEPLRVAPPPVPQTAATAVAPPEQSEQTVVASGKSGLETIAPTGVAAESSAPQVVARLETVSIPLPRVRPAKAPKPPEMTVAKLDPDVPLPPVRPEIAPEPEQPDAAPAAKHKSKWSRHRHRGHAHARAKAEKPVGLIALITKLTTPDKKPRRHRARAQAPSPSRNY